MRVGILGGTFDPVHNGHVAAAEAAIECGALDRVVFVPAARPPHRPPGVASATQRLEMCRLAVGADSRFEVSDIELLRSGLSYTLDTLVALQSARIADELFLVLGWDAARYFKTWHEPSKVQALAQILVISRPGLTTPQPHDLVAAGLDPSRVVLCLRPTPDIAGSELRRAVSAGQSISRFVPHAVETYIASHHLYGG